MTTSNEPKIEFVAVDDKMYRGASDIIKSVFLPENAVGVDISFKLSTTPRDRWEEVCKEVDAKHGTEFVAQFQPLSSLNYFVMMEDGKPIGVSGIYSLKGEEKEAWVGWLGVAESAQGKGYGKKVLGHVLDLARENGAKTLRLWTEADETFKTAHGMYERSGFQHERDVVGEPHPGYQTTYQLYSVNLSDATQPTTKWPLASLNIFGLAGGISPHQIVDNGERTYVRPERTHKIDAPQKKL